jgi:hypothetical protein
LKSLRVRGPSRHSNDAGDGRGVSLAEVGHALRGAIFDEEDVPPCSGEFFSVQLDLIEVLPQD